MALHENPAASSGKTTVPRYVDALLRVIASFLALVFLLGAFWQARDGTYPNITGLSQAALMFLCVASPLRPSIFMRVALLVAAIFAVFDFVVRALPGLRQENYPSDIVMIYFAELVIAIWFIRKHLRRRTSATELSSR